MANKVRAEVEKMLEEKFEAVKAAAKEAQFKIEKIDVTEPGREVTLGVKHPLTITIEEVSKVFMNMGFSISEGPEVETVFNNFDALNAGPNHPSRDMTDTFYITKDTLLRTQTSPVPVRTLLRAGTCLSRSFHREDASDATLRMLRIRRCSIRSKVLLSMRE